MIPGMLVRVLGLVSVLLLPTSAWAQSDRASWISWTRDHHFPVTSIVTTPNDPYADLEFLASILEGRRIVQLGESGHGVAEFNHAKVRLIKFLHSRLGYDVMAFESSIFECFMANGHTGTPAQMLAASIFGVWATEEVRALFEYIKETQKTDRPLILAGFDTQISSSGGASQRPRFFQSVINAIDRDYATEVFEFDAQVVAGLRTGAAYAKAEETRLVEFYDRLETFLRQHRAELAAAFPGDPSPAIAERAAWSVIRYVKQLVASIDRPNDTSLEGGTGIRDAGMADNLTFLARTVYPDRKIMVWAHNFHIRHDNAATSASAPKTMGAYIAERHRPELYTIGLYMNRGTAAQNNRVVYAIQPAAENSMEGVMAGVGPATLFVDLLHQTPQPGNQWMFQRILTREWGTNNQFMIPRDQYDGVLYVDLVNPPKYLTVF